jgi:ribosomal 50S subunit-associated protein YjgA (DUF615 family)
LQCPLREVPGEERLAAAVLAANGFDDGAATRYLVQFLAKSAREVIDPYRKLIEPFRGHGAAS